MDRLAAARALALGFLVCLLAACAAARPAAPVPQVPPVPAVFESEEFVVVFAKPDDTTGTLAARLLGDPDKAWMVEEFNELTTLTPGQEVVIPKRPWNPVGVEPSGYQLVPVLCYHDIGPEPKEKLRIGVKAFEEQMRYLKAQGYRVVSLKDFLEFAAQKRQLPRKTVVLTFDDGWRSFRPYAQPILKELGFTATLFIYTDFVGGRSALTWADLRELAQEGFDIQAHSKTHEDLRRRPGESDTDYARRMEAELAQPRELIRRQLGLSSGVLAYPFGAHDEPLVKLVKQYGYTAAFDVRRQGNAAFARPLALHRSQIYASMGLEDFVKNLNVLSQPSPPPSMSPPPVAPVSPPLLERLTAEHRERARALERSGRLRRALDEWKIALTIDPGDPAARDGQYQLEQRIEGETARRVEQGRQALGRGDHVGARRNFLAALALDPRQGDAFRALQNDLNELHFITHTVRPRETLATIAERYYGDRSRAEVIWEINELPPGARLAAGTPLRIPEIPGVPFREEAPGTRAELPKDEPAATGGEPREVSPLLALAQESLEKGEYGVALADVDKLLASNAQSAEGLDLKKAILYRLGKQQLDQRRFEESYQTLTRLTKLAPGYQDTTALLGRTRDRLAQQHYTQGVRLFQEERLEAAIAEWQKVLEYDPQHANAKRNIDQAERLLRNLQQRRQPPKQ
jgi:peptidoglycan/xylan/chitin deacetylase (PgdA/CDA1 family)